jgi:SAM-dependent methyltransferase
VNEVFVELFTYEFAAGEVIATAGKATSLKNVLEDVVAGFPARSVKFASTVTFPSLASVKSRFGNDVERLGMSLRKVFLAVLGSVSPWIEAICIAFGAREVATVDYVPVTVESPHIVAYAVGAAALRQKRFDVVVSYSSLEHDGLGRYGDPIDPDGDVAAVEEAFDMLRPGGTFVCGLPVGAGCIEGNFHRIYNRKRLDRLFRIFGATASALEANKNVVPWPPSADACDYSGARWQNQPVFILQRPLCVLPL